MRLVGKVICHLGMRLDIDLRIFFIGDNSFEYYICKKNYCDCFISKILFEFPFVARNHQSPFIIQPRSFSNSNRLKLLFPFHSFLYYHLFFHTHSF